MKNQTQKKGISLIALIITIIVIVLLAAIVVNTAITTPSSANFAKFASDMGEIQQAVTLAYFDMYSVEAVKTDSKSDADIYKEIAQGNGASVSTSNVPSGIDGTVAWKINDTSKIESIKDLPNYGDLYLTNVGVVYLAEGYSHQGNTYLTASVKLNGSSGAASNTITNSTGEDLKNYTIYGNSIQDGTPNPTSPVDIQSLGDNGAITVTRYGKNLLDTSILTDASNYTINSWYNGEYKAVKLVIPNGNYTFSVKHLSNYTPSNVLTIYSSVHLTDGVKRIYEHISAENYNNDTSFIVNVTNGCVYLSAYNPVTENLKKYYNSVEIKLEFGSTATDYEPYRGQKYEINLGSHEPLHGIGSVADSLDYATGKITRRIGVISSYNGETINTSYLSTTGELSTGATIYYELAVPYEDEGTISMPKVSTLEGLNTITASDGNVGASKVDATYYQK